MNQWQVCSNKQKNKNYIDNFSVVPLSAENCFDIFLYQWLGKILFDQGVVVRFVDVSFIYRATKDINFWFVVIWFKFLKKVPPCHLRHVQIQKQIIWMDIRYVLQSFSCALKLKNPKRNFYIFGNKFFSHKSADRIVVN